MKTIFTIIGMVAGVYLVKLYALDMVEQIGWELFWDSIKEGHLTENDIKNVVLKSTTFYKSVAGAVVGGVVGNMMGNLVVGGKQQK